MLMIYRSCVIPLLSEVSSTVSYTKEHYNVNTMRTRYAESTRLSESAMGRMLI